MHLRLNSLSITGVHKQQFYIYYHVSYFILLFYWNILE